MSYMNNDQRISHFSEVYFLNNCMYFEINIPSQMRFFSPVMQHRPIVYYSLLFNCLITRSHCLIANWPWDILWYGLRISIQIVMCIVCRTMSYSNCSRNIIQFIVYIYRFSATLTTLLVCFVMIYKPILLSLLLLNRYYLPVNNVKCKQFRNSLFFLIPECVLIIFNNQNLVWSTICWWTILTSSN